MYPAYPRKYENNNIFPQRESSFMFYLEAFVQATDQSIILFNSMWAQDSRNKRIILLQSGLLSLTFEEYTKFFNLKNTAARFYKEKDVQTYSSVEKLRRIKYRLLSHGVLPFLTKFKSMKRYTFAFT